MGTIKISIPTPCHENWAEMTPVDKGRFCASCQKKVFDFTKTPDREIAQAYKRDKHLCGRFLQSQLERDLVIPKEKNRIWAAAGAAAVTLIIAGTDSLYAQETVNTEASPITAGKTPDTFVQSPVDIKGTVMDQSGMAIPGVTIKNLTTNTMAQTDFDGLFSIAAMPKDTLRISYIAMKETKIIINEDREYKIVMENEILGEIFMGEIRPASPFKRFYYRIINLFR